MGLEEVIPDVWKPLTVKALEVKEGRDLSRALESNEPFLSNNLDPFTDEPDNVASEM